MEVRTERVGDVPVMRIEGSLDASSPAALREEVQQLLGAGERWVVLDLARADHVAGAAIRTLLMLRGKLARSGGGLLLCAASAPVREALEVTGVAGSFETLPAVEAAVRRVEAERAADEVADRVAELLRAAEERDEAAESKPAPRSAGEARGGAP